MNIQVEGSPLYYYGEIDETKKVTAYYIEDLHGKDFCASVLAKVGVRLDSDLHDYLISLGSVRFEGVISPRVYNMEDKSMFTQILPEPDVTPKPPSANERLEALEAALMGVL